MYQIVLASGSPRRHEILNQVGIRHTVLPNSGEELTKEGETPEEMVIRLSYNKASFAAEDIPAPAVIIGADTVVVHRGEILGKPGTHQKAGEMVGSLAGDLHEVVTGVCAIIKEEDGGNRAISFSEKSGVEVCPMKEEQIAAYAATDEPLDKAGAYAVQGEFAIYIKKIDGNFDNIVGLPVSRLYQEVYAAGIDLKTGEKVRTF